MTARSGRSSGPSAAEARALPREFGDLPVVMAHIEALMDRFAAMLPARQRRLVPNALLNVAVARLLMAERPTRAATILLRLAELIAAGRTPQGDDAFPLTGHDA
jgi:hypothetical protein